MAKGKGKQVAGKALSTAKATPSTSGKRKNVASTAAEDSGGRVKRRPPGVLQFFDDAAADADSWDDEDEEEEEEDADFGVTDLMDDTKAQTKVVKGSGKTHHLPFFLKEEELSDDELEELIKDRYGRGSECVVYDESSKECHDRELAEDIMMESPIWRVKCMVGRERQIAFCFMQKYVDLKNFGNKLRILSTFALDHIKGYVFVEAEKHCDVAEACKGFCSVYSNRISLVPRNELSHLLSIRNKPFEVSKGTWVRMKSGRYKGDLAQVVAVDEGRRRVMVKLVPRVDLQAIAKKFGGGVSLKKAAVPTPRLISSRELETFRPHIELRRDRLTGELFEILDDLMLKDGYLYKKVSVGSLFVWGVQPTHSELVKFSDESKNEVEDLNWVSSVYVASKKKRIEEPSDHMELPTKGSGFNLHDLVLFGRKAFGVIIAVEKDCYRVLKGDMEGPEVATVKIQDIKNCCVDKMFIASDKDMKTISINDKVVVSEGPLQGKQGIVRHMYKGTLFIYDENETENGGFFRAKSNVCEIIKESKDPCSENLDSRSAPPFAQSPMRSYEQQDGARESSRHHQSNRHQLFSIGQTLRINKGPLKGYLCRVVRIYRSDVTVKLDSLMKLMTVEESFLSVANKRRDDSYSMASDPFGTREGLSIGGLSDGGAGPQADKNSWDVVAPSFSRDSWQPFSTSNLLVASSTDHKAEQESEADPWGSKVSSGAWSDAGNSEKAVDGWGEATGASGVEDSPWSKAAAGKEAIDGVKHQAGGSGNDAEGWNRVSVRNITEVDGWGKAELPTRNAGESWGGGNQPDHSVSTTWHRPSEVELCDSSKNDGDVSGWEKAVSNKSKGKADNWDQSSSRICPEVLSNDKADAWDVKGKGIIGKEDDAWGMAANQEKDTNESKDWGGISGQSKEKGIPIGWGSQADNWDAAASLRSQSGVQHGSASSSWEKAKDNWGKAKDKSGGEASGWNGEESTNRSQTDNWSTPKSFGGDHISSWNRGVENEDSVRNDEMDSWNKPRNFEEGHGFGQGRGKRRNEGESRNADQDSNWNRQMDSDGGRGSSWGGGRNGNHEGGGGRGQQSSWNRSRDFDGGRHSFGRGRGRYGGRGGRGEGNNWNGPGDQDSGWRSARVGRGRDGEAGQNSKNLDDSRPFGCGQGRGRGHGGLQSSDWKDDQETFMDGSFSKDSFSNWANNQNSGWGSSKGYPNNEAARNIGRQDGWDSAGWKSVSEGAGGSRNRNDVDPASSRDKGMNAGKEAGNSAEKWDTPKSSNWDQETFMKDAAGAEGNYLNACKTHEENRSSVWDKLSCGNEHAGKGAGVGCNWNSAKPSGGQSSGWTGKFLDGKGKVDERTAGDQEFGADPWGCKVKSGTKAEESTSIDSWGETKCAGGEQHSQSSKNAAFEKASDDIKHRAGGSGNDADCGNMASFRNNTEVDCWEKAELSGRDAGENWGGGSFRIGNQSDSTTNNWDQSRVAQSCDSLRKDSGVSGWEKAVSGKDNGNTDNWDQSSSQTCPKSLSNVKADAWDIKGKGIIGKADDAWGGTAAKSQGKDTNTSKDWGGGSASQSKEKDPQSNVGSKKADNWDAAASRWNQSGGQHGGATSSWEQAKDSWGKTKDTSEAEAGGLNRVGSSSHNQTDNWSTPRYFGSDHVSTWNGGVKNEESVRNDQMDSWNKPRNFEGGRGFGRGRGRGRNGGESRSADQGGSWSRRMDSDGGRGSNWGGGRSGYHEAGGEGDQGSSWNRSWGFDGGRDSFGRGRGRYGARGGRGEEGKNWNGPRDRDGGWGYARGGRDLNGDGSRPFGHGRGPVHGRGGFQSSDWRNDQKKSMDGRFSKDSSSLASDQTPGWGTWKGKNEATENVGSWGGGWEKPAGSSGKAMEAGGSGDQGGSLDRASGWGGNTKEAGSGGDEGSGWEKAGGSWGKARSESGGGGGW